MTEIVRELTPSREPNENQGNAYLRRSAEAIEDVFAGLRATTQALGRLAELQDRFLSTQPPLRNGTTIHPNSFESPDVYYIFLARMSRDLTHDPYELEGTTAKVSALITELHKPVPVYTKTRSTAHALADPEYTLGNIVTTTALVKQDNSSGLPRNELVLRITTPNVHGSAKLSEIKLSDLNAQFGPQAPRDTSTPVVVAGRIGVGEVVRRAYDDPRVGRRASGHDPYDIFAALCESGLHLRELGFAEDDIALRKKEITARLGRVCGEGELYMREALMLPAVCETRSEAMNIIAEAIRAGQEGSAGSRQYVPDQLVQDYRSLGLTSTSR